MSLVIFVSLVILVSLFIIVSLVIIVPLVIIVSLVILVSLFIIVSLVIIVLLVMIVSLFKLVSLSSISIGYWIQTAPSTAIAVLNRRTGGEARGGYNQLWRQDQLCLRSWLGQAIVPGLEAGRYVAE
jgi:hypothetical protein